MIQHVVYIIYFFLCINKKKKVKKEEGKKEKGTDISSFIVQIFTCQFKITCTSLGSGTKSLMWLVWHFHITVVLMDYGNKIILSFLYYKRTNGISCNFIYRLLDRILPWWMVGVQKTLVCFLISTLCSLTNNDGWHQGPWWPGFSLLITKNLNIFDKINVYVVSLFFHRFIK
jgi:hypothetical protein